MYSTTQAYTPGANLDATRSLLIGMKEKGTLQSYVAQHKNSPEYPYLLALASSINQISDATKAAQHQPAPQTVADQSLNALAPAPAPQASMQLPENVGIGQLPAKNIQNMAGGGIVAFDEGGEVPRFNGQTGSVPMTYGEQMGNLGNFLMQIPRRLVSDPSLAQEERRAAALKAAEEQQRKITEGINAIPASTTSSTSPSNADIENMIGMGASSKTDGAGAGAGTGGAGSTGTRGAASMGGGASQGLAGLMKEMKPYLPEEEKAPADRAGFMKEREDLRKPVYEKMTEMIEKEKGKLKDDKEQSFFMSMIEGGLAAAGGSSQHGLQNLAQGFAKGTASFGDSLKDIRKAARENSKMEMEATRMQAADKIGDMDAYQRAEEAYKDRKNKRDSAITASVFGIAGDKMKADAQVKAAGIAANAPSAQERLFMALGGGDINKGLERFQTAQADKTGASYAKLYSDYAANADKAGADKMSPIEFAQNIQQFMGALQGGGFQKKPTGDVYKLPGT